MTVFSDPILKYLGPGGLLAQAFPNYEHRPQQLEMARLVRRALDERRYCLVEAGTGTGKTLAYLVPSLLSGRRVVVSTATKTLQDQILEKDLPLLRKAAGIDFKATVLKGRANYLCRYRMELAERAGQAHLFAGARREYEAVARWSRLTETGEWTELDLPEGSAVRRELSCGSESCPGRKCPYSGVCFVTRARREAADSDLVIVNHHLLFADLALKTDLPGNGAQVIPPYQAVVFDEAHAVEDVATDFFGVSLSAFRVHELVEDVERAAAQEPGACPMAPTLLERIDQFSTRLFNQRGLGIPGTEGVRRLTEALDADELALQIDPLVGALRALPGAIAQMESVEKDTFVRRISELAAGLEFMAAMDDPCFVYWEERRGRSQVFLRAAPIDVAREFRARLYTTADTIIFTSATLAAEGRLDFTRRRLGLPPPGSEARGPGAEGTGAPAGSDEARRFETPVDELLLDSPFDYQRQAALYTPRHLPEPNAPEFIGRAAEEIASLCSITGGRALLLFTSLKNMTLAHALLREKLPCPVMIQGEAPRGALIARFRSEPSALFASHSFWEGVDIPGEALSLVVIDRLPFASPTDPVVAARVEWLKASGRAPFICYQVPQAALSLRQGFGRLIRTRTDRGIVAILDPRLTTKRYGGAFLKSLPPARRCADIREVREFWEAGIPGGLGSADLCKAG